MENVVPESVARALDVPRDSFFLFGPRGTGKSTWVRERFPEALFVDLLDPPTQRALLARPESLRERIDAHPERRWIVIDEVQKVPALLEVVHALIEERRDLSFVLTGSSARKLRRGGVDLLAGRCVLRSLHPFMASELGHAFDLERALAEGLVPVVWAAREPRDVLDAYAQLYVREEVQTEGLVRHVGSFARFLEAVSLSHASVLNTSNVARECEVGRKTVDGYLQILEDLLLSFRVPAFARRAARKVTRHPKLYLFDAGVYRSLRPRGLLDSSEEAEGAALEGLVAQHLRAWMAYRRDGHTLSFWRTQSGTEVDFIVYGPTGFWALEVKAGDHVRPRDLRGLATFREDYPECRAALLYGGRERRVVSGLLCVPVEAFLRALRPESTLDVALDAGA